MSVMLNLSISFIIEYVGTLPTCFLLPRSQEAKMNKMNLKSIETTQNQFYGCSSFVYEKGINSN